MRQDTIMQNASIQKAKTDPNLCEPSFDYAKEYVEKYPNDMKHIETLTETFKLSKAVALIGNEFR